MESNRVNGPAEYLEENPGQSASRFFTQWQRYLAFLRRLWWIPLLAMMVSLAVVAYQITQEPTTYVSRARLWVSGKLQIPEGSLYTEELQFFFGTQRELLQSEKIQQRARNRVSTLNPNLAACTVNLRVIQVQSSAMFILEASGTDSNYIQAFLDALIDEYFNYKKEVRSNTSENTLSLIYESVREQEKALKTAQDDLTAYQQDNNLDVLQQQGTSAGNYLSKLNVEVADLKLDYQLMEITATNLVVSGWSNEWVTNLAAKGSALADYSLSSDKGGGDLGASQQQLVLLRLELADASQNLQPQHPKIQKLNESIGRAEKILELQRQSNQELLAARKQTLKLKIDQLESSITNWQSKLQESNRRIAQFDRLKVNVQRIQVLYERLLSLLQSVDVNKSLQQEIMSLMERASKAAPMRAKTTSRLIMALVFGWFGGMGLVFVVGKLDDRMMSMDEVLDRFEEEIVGQVPDIPLGKSKAKLALLETEDKRYTFAESFRNIRSSLLFMTAEGQRPKTILISSAAPSEGKSTVAANLACVLALSGAKVLLVDADLRRGALNDLVGAPRQPGLSDLLHEGANGDLGIVPTTIPSLSFLAAGQHLTASGELFLSSRFDHFLKQSREGFDFVIVDSPPVFAADDATTLAPKLDAVLFVIRSSYTRGRLARQALNLLRQRQANILGLVFNRANISSRSYYYYKYGTYYHPARAASHK